MPFTLVLLALMAVRRGAQAAGRVGQVHEAVAEAARVGGHGGGGGVQLDVGGGVELVVARGRGVLPGGRVGGGELHVAPPVHVRGPEVPGGEVALVAVRRHIRDALAGPVGPADARAVPEVDGVVPPQEHVLVARPAVPTVLEHLRAAAVPHHQARPPPAPREGSTPRTRGRTTASGWR